MLSLPDFTWLVRCSIVTNPYSLQSLKAIFFGYFHAVGAGAQARLLRTVNVLDIFLCPVSIIEPKWLGPEKIILK